MDELVQNPDLFISPVVLAPGEELIGHVIFTPDSTMKSLNGHMNITSDYPKAISIPITATITLPPVVTTDSVIVRLTMQQSDSAKRFIQLGNTGKGDLNYTLGIQYRRPGINYNSVAKAAPLKAKSKNAVNTVFGSGFSASLSDIPSSTLEVQEVLLTLSWFSTPPTISFPTSEPQMTPFPLRQSAISMPGKRNLPFSCRRFISDR